MENLRKQKIKAYILLESLVALSIFVFIATVVVDSVNKSRKAQVLLYQKEEVLRLSQMAIQTGGEELSLNGHQVVVHRSAQMISVYEGQK